VSRKDYAHYRKERKKRFPVNTTKRSVMMFQRIVVPLDGSILAEQALPVAARIARASGASLILLRVLIALPGPDQGLTWGMPVNGQVVSDEERAGATAYLSHVEDLDDLEGLGVATEVAEGDVAHTILSVAQDQQADLIVMSSHGYTGLRHWALGSVAENVARHSPVPVFVLRDMTGSSAALQTRDHIVRVVVAVDGSIRAEAALPSAVSLAVALAYPAHAELHLARVLPLAYSEEKIAVQSDRAALKARDYLSSLEERICRQYKEAAMLSTITASVSLDVDIAGALVDLAEKGIVGEDGKRLGGYDVIVMGTHGRGGLQRWMLGSVTERVLHRTKLPLLVVHTGHKWSRNDASASVMHV
jgi:nucleotide-binding universal stress UspA family protein